MTLTALFLSVAVHASVLLVGLAVVRSTRDTPPSVSFSLGDGGTDGGFFTADGSGGLAPASSPEARNQGAVSAPQEDAVPFALPEYAEQHLPPRAAQWHVPAATSLADDRPEEPPFIGLPSQSYLPTTGPRFRSGRAGGSAFASTATAAPTAGRPEGTGSGTLGSADGGGDGGGAGGAGEGSGRPGTPAGLAGNRLPAPVYPKESRLRGEEGLVVLEIDVAANGTVTAIRVAADCPFPRLTRAAMDAVRKAKFTPATRDGVAVASSVRVPFRFSLR